MSSHCRTVVQYYPATLVLPLKIRIVAGSGMAYFPSNLNGPGALSLGFRDNRKLLIGIRTGPGGFSSQYKRGCQHRMSRRQRQVSTCRCFFDAQEAGYEHRCTHRHRLRQAPAPGRNSTAVRRYLLEIARNCPACCGSTQHNWCSTNCGSPGCWMPCRLTTRKGYAKSSRFMSRRVKDRQT